MNNQKRNFDNFIQDTGQVEDSLIKLGPNELGSRFKSKHDIYTYLTEILGYYLPPIDGVNRDFLRQILKGEKKLMKMEQIKMIKVPKYDELSVKALYQNILEDGEIVSHLPDMNEKSKPIDREFFFNILNTIQPDYINHIIKKAQEIRNCAGNQNGKQNYVLISDEWYSQLTQHPFISKKSGRTMQLLKASSKIFKARKPKQQQIQAISLKRFKGVENQSATKMRSFLNNQEIGILNNATNQEISSTMIGVQRFNI